MIHHLFTLTRAWTVNRSSISANAVSFSRSGCSCFGPGLAEEQFKVSGGLMDSDVIPTPLYLTHGHPPSTSWRWSLDR